MTVETKPRPFSLADMHPAMAAPLRTLLDATDAKIFTLADGGKLTLRPFEGFRLPQRQYDLLARGKVTKAGPWESAHQYGLAVDFACRGVDPVGMLTQWTWEAPDVVWHFLRRVARSSGLDIPIRWDKGHVCHPLWNEIKSHW